MIRQQSSPTQDGLDTVKSKRHRRSSRLDRIHRDDLHAEGLLERLAESLVQFTSDACAMNYSQSPQSLLVSLYCCIMLEITSTHALDPLNSLITAPILPTHFSNLINDHARIFASQQMAMHIAAFHVSLLIERIQHLPSLDILKKIIFDPNCILKPPYNITDLDSTKEELINTSTLNEEDNEQSRLIHFLRQEIISQVSKTHATFTTARWQYDNDMLDELFFRAVKLLILMRHTNPTTHLFFPQHDELYSSQCMELVNNNNNLLASQDVTLKVMFAALPGLIEDEYLTDGSFIEHVLVKAKVWSWNDTNDDNSHSSTTTTTTQLKEKKSNLDLLGGTGGRANTLFTTTLKESNRWKTSLTQFPNYR